MAPGFDCIPSSAVPPEPPGTRGLFTFTLVIVIWGGEAIQSPLRKTHVDSIIQVLKEQEWHEGETQCIQDTLKILHNVKNHTIWAVWIWNSMHHATGTFYGSRYSLGNYDQCLKAPSNLVHPTIRTQYCLLDVRLTNDVDEKGKPLDVFGVTDNFFKIKSNVGRSFNVLSWGTCLPASCNARAVTKIMKLIYFWDPLASADPYISVDNCQLACKKTNYSFGFYVFFTLMASLVVAAISSTIYLQYNKDDTRLTRVVYSFSLQRNWSSLTKITGDELASVNFTKTVQIIVITCVHVFLFSITGAVGNAVDFDQYFIKKDFALGNLVQHIDLICVENFIVISGLLFMKNLVEKRKNPIIGLIQRYIRLIGSLTFLVFFIITVSKFTGDGPLWTKFVRKEQEACEQNWMWSISGLKIACQIVTWYVQCDFQLAIIGTSLYYIWKWNKRVGKITAILISSLGLVWPGIITYVNRMRGIFLYDMDKIIDLRSNEVFLDIQMKSHLRCTSYFIAMALGYVLTVYRPAKYRGVISRQWSVIGFVISGLLGFKVWTSAAAWCLGEYDAWNSALFATFHKIIWTLSTCLSIIIAEYGDIPQLQSIFAWPVFVIISRLGYGIYITHSLILQRNIFSQRSPMHFDIFGFITTGFGVILESLCFAVLLWLFIEAPLSNLTNLVLTPGKMPVVNGIKHKYMDEKTEIYKLKYGNGK